MAGLLQLVLPCPNLWQLKQRRGFGTKISTYFGGVGLLNVRIKVFVGTTAPSLFDVKCLTWVTPSGLSASKTSASSQSRRSRLRMTPFELFSDLCGVTLIGTSTQVVIFNAFLACCFELTSTSTAPLRSFLADFTSPTAHFKSFCIPKIERFIVLPSLGSMTKNDWKLLHFLSSSSSETIKL